MSKEGCRIKDMHVWCCSLPTALHSFQIHAFIVGYSYLYMYMYLQSMVQLHVWGINWKQASSTIVFTASVLCNALETLFLMSGSLAERANHLLLPWVFSPAEVRSGGEGRGGELAGRGVGSGWWSKRVMRACSLSALNLWTAIPGAATGLVSLPEKKEWFNYNGQCVSANVWSDIMTHQMNHTHAWLLWKEGK